MRNNFCGNKSTIILEISVYLCWYVIVSTTGRNVSTYFYGKNETLWTFWIVILMLFTTHTIQRIITLKQIKYAHQRRKSSRMETVWNHKAFFSKYVGKKVAEITNKANRRRFSPHSACANDILQFWNQPMQKQLNCQNMLWAKPIKNPSYTHTCMRLFGATCITIHDYVRNLGSSL